MINGLGNLLSYADNSVSANNNNTYSLNNYNYDDSFANMLNKTQNEESYSNKIIETHNNDYKEYNNNNNDDYNSYEDYSSSSEETVHIDKKENNNTEKLDDKKTIKEKTENTETKEAKTEEAVSEKNVSDDNNEKEEAKAVKENISEKEKLSLTKEKAKLLLQNACISENSKKADGKETINRENTLSKTDKKENTKIIEEIDNLKKEIESINLEELSEEDKKELADFLEALESLKAMMDNNDENSDKKIIADDNVKIKDAKLIDDNKEVKIASNKEDNKPVEMKEINDADITVQNDNAAAIDMNIESKYADRYDKDNAENKNNANSSINNTISDDKGAELTIINMKDSAEGANLKGYNHYNNVSKTHNSPNLSDSIVKFQDLMGKLVEKAQVAINNGKSEVLMTLNPEYLGKVRLKINMDGDNLVGKIFVDNAEVKDIFTKNLDTVISSLNEIGINIEGFDVMLRQDMPNNGEFGEELGNNRAGFAFENNENAEEVNADIKTYIVSERKLNLLI